LRKAEGDNAVSHRPRQAVAADVALRGKASIRLTSVAPAIGHIDVRNFTRGNELIALGRRQCRSNWPAIAALG
jgi:hypothetical protein